MGLHQPDPCIQTPRTDYFFFAVGATFLPFEATVALAEGLVDLTDVFGFVSVFTGAFSGSLGPPIISGMAETGALMVAFFNGWGASRIVGLMTALAGAFTTVLAGGFVTDLATAGFALGIGYRFFGFGFWYFRLLQIGLIAHPVN